MGLNFNNIPRATASITDSINAFFTREWYLFFQGLSGKGTWTPEIKGSTTDPTITYDVAIGEYMNVGNLIQCNVHIVWSGYSGGSGDVKITLPFAVSNSIDIGGVISSCDGIDFVGDFITIEGETTKLTAKIMTVVNGGISNELTVADLQSSGFIKFNMIYKN
jgi:hypothetical protein